LELSRALDELSLNRRTVALPAPWHPLLALPGVYSKPTWEPATQTGPAVQLQSAEVWILQRMMIAEGLPRDSHGSKIYEMTRHNASTLEYLNEILDEHRRYYRQSFHNLHRDHS